MPKSRDPDLEDGGSLFNEMRGIVNNWVDAAEQKSFFNKQGYLNFESASFYYKQMESLRQKFPNNAQFGVKGRALFKKVVNQKFKRYKKTDEQNKESVGTGFGSPSGTNPKASFYEKKPEKKSTTTRTQETVPPAKAPVKINRIEINKEKTMKNPPFITKLSARTFKGRDYLYLCFDLPPAIKDCVMTSSRDGKERAFKFEVPQWLYKNPPVLLGDATIEKSNLILSVLEEWKTMSKENHEEKYFYTLTFILPFPTIVTTRVQKCPSADFGCDLPENNQHVFGKDSTSQFSDVYFRRVSFFFKSISTIYNDTKNKPVKEKVAVFLDLSDDEE